MKIICNKCHIEKEASLEKDKTDFYYLVKKKNYGLYKRFSKVCKSCLSEDYKQYKKRVMAAYKPESYTAEIKYASSVRYDKEIKEALTIFRKDCGQTEAIRHILRWFLFGISMEDHLLSMKEENKGKDNE
jgi:hypothetical protein